MGAFKHSHRQYHSKREKGAPTFDSCLQARDYHGALVLLDNESHLAECDKQLWTAYIHSHQGHHIKVQSIYESFLNGKHSMKGNEVDCQLYLACTYYHLGMFDRAGELAKSVEPEAHNKCLHARLLNHLGIDEKCEEDDRSTEDIIVQDDNVENIISSASMKFNDGDYQEAIGILKNITVDHDEYEALNIYIAKCYYKLDYYDIATELLDSYLFEFPDSPTAMNMKSALKYKTADARAALSEFKPLMSQNYSLEDNVYIQHNHAIFSGGKGCQETLSELVDVVEEAKINLATFHIIEENFEDALEALEDVETLSSNSLIIKATALAMEGQAKMNRRMIKESRSYFERVGASTKDCDTIPGRQSMAASLFLGKNFDDANIYLSSIKQYLEHDDDFNWNYGICLAATGDYPAAECTLLKIESMTYISEAVYLKWLSRCLIANNKAQNAWELYLEHENDVNMKESLVESMANDFYRYGHFHYAARAFEILFHLGQHDKQVLWEALRGACVGVFQNLISMACSEKSNPELMLKTEDELLTSILPILRSKQNPQAEHITNTIRDWLKVNQSSLK